MSERIIAVVSDKGGVGKTTGATSVAHGLARRDARVLLVDFDLLGQDAIVLGMDPMPGVYEYFVRGAAASDVVCETGRPGLHLLPGNSWTRRADSDVRVTGMAALTESLRLLTQGYDFTVIDTHPSGYLQELAIRVASVVVIPGRWGALAMDGGAATLQVVGEIGNAAQVVILPTMYDERLNAHRYNYGLLRDAYPGRVAAPAPARVAVAEAHADGLTVWEYARRNELAPVRASYEQLLDWLMPDAGEALFGETEVVSW